MNDRSQHASPMTQAQSLPGPVDLSSIDRQTLHELRQRLERIEAVTDVKLATLEVKELLAEVLVRVRELLEADTAAVLLLDHGGQFLTLAAASGMKVSADLRLPLGQSIAGRAAAEGQPVLARISGATASQSALLRDDVRSVAAVPLLHAQAVLGVLHIGTVREREFLADDVNVLQLAADRIAGAIATRRAYLDRVTAASLQRSLAPRQLPRIPGLDLAARYLSGSQYGVSGDWYDVFSLPDGRVGLVVGDVMGHGLRAATVMGRLKSALRAYALEHDDPGVVLSRLDRKIQHFEPGQMATVIYGILDPNSGQLAFSSAGHLPPVLTVPHADPTVLELPAGLPLGVRLDRARLTHHLTVAPGSRLCLFTDGLFDQRNSSLDDGLQAVRSTLFSSSPALDTADGTCTELLQVLLANRIPDDDVTMLVLRRE